MSSSPTSKRNLRPRLISTSHTPLTLADDGSSTLSDTFEQPAEPSGTFQQSTTQENPRKRRVWVQSGPNSIALASSGTSSSYVNPGVFVAGSAELETPPQPVVKKGRTNAPWTAAEEQRIKTMRDAGSSWSEIAKTFPTRTEGSVKKHWYKDMHYAEFAEDEHQVSIEALAFQTLQREYDDLLQKLERQRTKCATLEKKFEVSDVEINTLTGEKEMLQAQVAALEKQVEELQQNRDEARNQLLTNGAQYMGIMEMANRLQAQGAEDKRRWAAEKGELERRIKVLEEAMVTGASSPDEATRMAAEQLYQVSGSSTHAMSPPIQSPLITATTAETVTELRAEISRLRTRLQSLEAALQTMRDDGSKLASGSYEKTVRVWNFATGQTEQMIEQAGADSHAERGDLWEKASMGYTYHDIWQLTQDIEDAHGLESSISIKFKCQIPEVFRLTERQLDDKKELHADEVFNHVALVKRSAKDDAGRPTQRIEAITCLEYIERQWGPLGKQILMDILDLCEVKAGLPLQNCYENTNRSSTEYSLSLDQDFLFVNIGIAVFDRQLVIFISTLDWLCRAIRTPSQPNSGNFLVSQSSCSISLYRGNTNTGISLNFSLLSNPLPELDHNCWRRLFRSCFVLEEEGICNIMSPSGKGLEMSFDLMVSLAAAEYPVNVNGGVVLVGYQTVLIPTEVEATYTQFHLEIEENQQINPFTLRYGPRALVTDYTKFKSKRCFVGWCEVAYIKLGTPALPARVKYSSAEEKRKTLHLTGISTGIQVTSAFPIQAGANGQANFSFVSHHLYFRPPAVFSKMLRDASKQVVLVCDVTAQRSWLVPKLSLLIHMAHSWFLENSLPQDNISDPIPFAEPHDDGIALVEVFEGHGNLVICGHDDDAFRLRSLLIGLNINLLATVNLTERSTSQFLYGFEFMDVVLEPGKGSVMKKVKLKNCGNWLALANLVDAVILCSELGEAMAPAEGISRRNSFCNSLPSGQGYLAAHVSCLGHLVNRSGRQQLAPLLSSSQILLSQGRFWNISGEPFEACTHDNKSTDSCWKRANILQRVCSKDFLQRIHRIPEQNQCTSSRTLCLKGAVVFGKSSSRS